MATATRLARIHEVLGLRLGYLRCAVDAVYQRHNVSAILRTCDAVGIHHVHVVGHRFSATKGASRGAERWLDVHRHAEVAEAVDAIKADGFRLFVADLDEAAVTPDEVPLDQPLCLWMGQELEGVSPEARAAADGVVRIPMWGFTQSLNVSVAAAVALFPLAARVRALGDEALLPAGERAHIEAEWAAREDRLPGSLV